MFDSFDPRWNDPRDRDGTNELDRDIYRDSRERGDDSRDALLNDLDLPRGLERELVLDRDRVYELNGENSRTLAAVGVFRVVPERDLDSRDDALDCRNDSLEHLIEEGLVRTVSLDGHDRGVTLTDRGRELLEANRRDRDDDHQQKFYAGVNRPRELSHDAQLYRAYERAEKPLRDEVPRFGGSSSSRSLSASTSHSCRTTIATGQTAMGDRIGTHERSRSGRSNTSCRTLTTGSTCPTSESSTSSTVGRGIETLRF
jgi:hypothetical protein